MFLEPWFERVFFSRSRTVSGDKDSTSPNSTTLPARARMVQWSWPSGTGMQCAKPQLLIDIFYLPKWAGKKQKLDSRPNNTKSGRSNKQTAPKEPAHKRQPLTPEARKERRQTQHKEKLDRAKSLGLCRHCGEAAIGGQTRCDQCAEKHRISHRAYDRRRLAAANQKDEVLRAKPAQATLPYRATHDSTARASKPRPKPATATSPSPDRREYERLRRKRPERMEAKKRTAQERRRRARELGLCRDCNDKAIPEQTRCETCAEKHRQSRGRA